MVLSDLKLTSPMVRSQPRVFRAYSLSNHEAVRLHRLPGTDIFNLHPHRLPKITHLAGCLANPSRGLATGLSTRVS